MFLDPLYSSGLDLIAIGNGLITDMITRELDGEDVVARSGINDSLFRSLTDMWLNVYCNQYFLMGSPAVMSAKVIWDIAFYWGFLGFLYSNGRFVSVADDPGVVPHLEGLIELSNRMQRFFREWAAVESARPSALFCRSVCATELHGDAPHRDDGDAPDFTTQFDANVRLMRQLAATDRHRTHRKMSHLSRTTSCGRYRSGNGTHFCANFGPPTVTSKASARSARTGLSGPYLHSNSVDRAGLHA